MLSTSVQLELLIGLNMLHFFKNVSAQMWEDRLWQKVFSWRKTKYVCSEVYFFVRWIILVAWKRQLSPKINFPFALKRKSAPGLYFPSQWAEDEGGLAGIVKVAGAILESQLSERLSSGTISGQRTATTSYLFASLISSACHAAPRVHAALPRFFPSLFHGPKRADSLSERKRGVFL